MMRDRRNDSLFRRRLFFSGLTLSTIGGLTAALIALLAHTGRIGIADAVLVAAFTVNVTWLALGLWNAVIGLALLLVPGQERTPPTGDITGRVAVAMTIRNENPADVFARIRTIKDSLDATASGPLFDYYLLSDSSDPAIIASEGQNAADWQNQLNQPGRVTYRHRPVNDGFKPGNLRDFCRRWGDGYDILILLDADSLMTGATILDMVRTMVRQPRLGILQSLIVGILSPSFFARVFEFGHRHGLRCTMAGAVWWQGDRCQFWGHNAAIRLKPFIAQCEMPYLPGKGPFSGHIICHDQIEASFMHRAGYEVRVMAEESGSYEGVPPTLPDFMKRNHRWCQGNLKNLKIIGAPGLAAIDRFHLGVVAQRFLAGPALVAFALAATVLACSEPAAADAFPARSALILYGLWLGLLIFPKLAGLAVALRCSPARYGGALRLMLGGLTECLFTLVLTPVGAVGATVFMAGLICGRSLAWDQQARDGYRLSWRCALAGLWPQTLLGGAVFASLALFNPGALPWFAPFWLSLLLSVPFAVLTTSPALDDWAQRHGLCRIPEETEEPAEIAGLKRLKARLVPAHARHEGIGP